MKHPSLILGAVAGGLTSLPLLALFYLGERLAGLPFVPFDLFDWMARVLPGDLVTVGIDAIVLFVQLFNLGATDATAKLIEMGMALLMIVGLGMLLGATIAFSMRRSQAEGGRSGLLAGTILFLVVAAIELSFGLATGVIVALLWLALLLIGWGYLLGRFLAMQPAPPMTEADRSARRALLLKLAGSSAGIALGAWGVGSLGGRSEEIAESGAVTPLANVTAQPDATATAMATARERIMPAPGTRPEITPDGEFYRIDINTRPLVIDGESWQLQVGGLFDNPRPLPLEELMAFPAYTQALTMSCISNGIGGDLISSAYWTGARLRDVLEELGLQQTARELYIESADGFYESVSMMDMMDPRTLLVYGMNGATLPTEHGFPLRIYIPDRYGMKQPKWITRMEAIAEEGPGYWVERGWSEEARPRVISIIDSVARDAPQNGTIPIGGIAWAGDRGIQKVEVQVDEGEWAEAVLRNPPLSSLIWVQWRYDWPAVPGRHRFRVRATDGTGALQIEEEMPKRPDGATGYHAITETI